MSLEENDPETIARATLTLLETRLCRLEFLLTGSISTNHGQAADHNIPRKTQLRDRELEESNNNNNRTTTEQTPTTSKQIPVTTRLQQLQTTLTNLRNQRTPAGELLRDIERLQHKTPEIFTTNPTASLLSSSQQQQSKDQDPSLQASTILSHASLYPQTASQLSSLRTTPTPTATQSSTMINLQPRISKATQHAIELEQKSELLRARTAKVLEWYTSTAVLGMNELVVDWEGRCDDVERTVVRVERSRKG